MKPRFELTARVNVQVGSRYYGAGQKLKTPTGRVKSWRTQWAAMDFAQDAFGSAWRNVLSVLENNPAGH